MNKIIQFVVTRLFITLVSSALISFLIQLAVFRYTRFVKAPIPAGEIIGPPTEGFAMLIATLWFFAVIIFMFIGFGVFAFRLRAVSEDKKAGKLESYFTSISSVLRWSILPNMIGVLIAITLLVKPDITSATLRIFGYGGGIDICYETDNQINKESKVIMKAMFNAEVKGLGEEADATNSLRGELIYLTSATAFIQFPELSTPDNDAYKKEIGGIGNIIFVNLSDYIQAGYHQINPSIFAAAC